VRCRNLRASQGTLPCAEPLKRGEGGVMNRTSLCTYETRKGEDLKYNSLVIA
jgi:hypothetical protein